LETTESYLADPDDCKNYRIWGFELEFRTLLIPDATTRQVNVRVYTSIDAVTWDLLDTIYLTHTDAAADPAYNWSQDFRVTRRWYGLTVENPEDSSIQITLVTRKGN